MNVNWAILERPSFLLLALTGIILSQLMVPRWQYRTSLLLILLYISAGALVAVSHHDYVDLSLHQTARLAGHECGANEIHIPLDKRHECLACLQTTMRVTTAATSAFLKPTQFVYICCIVFGNERTSYVYILHSGKRGPPLFS